jgi:hypothetical protein
VISKQKARHLQVEGIKRVTKQPKKDAFGELYGYKDTIYFTKKHDSVTYGYRHASKWR